MTGFLLIRHTSHDLIDRAVAGRMDGVHLNDAGRQQAERLAQDLATVPIGRIFSGPLERVRETADPLGKALHLPVEIALEFDEINTGDWTGKTFDELSAQQDWKRWNLF